MTAEQISGLARVVRANAQAGYENVALWHERDILPDSTTLADYLLSKTANLVDTMFVYPERMRANLESTRGLIFSGQLFARSSRTRRQPRGRLPPRAIAR